MTGLPDTEGASNVNNHSGKIIVEDHHPMTLVEILVAIVILAFGMMGIIAVVPYAIRNTTGSLHKSVAGSVAQTVAVSLKHYYMDLSMVDEGNPWDQDLSQHFQTGSYPICIPADTQIGSLITWDTVPFSDSYNYSGRGNYSWTATIQKPDPDSDGYPLQIAVWRRYRTVSSTLNTVYKADSPTIVAADTTLRVQMGDYVSLEDLGVWRHVAGTREETDKLTIILSAPFKNATSIIDTITKDSHVYTADNKDLISVYSTTIPK